MQSSFGTKLFRLFLAFALAPAVLLALAGYYLAVETSWFPSRSMDRHARQLSDYYRDFLFAQLDTCLTVGGADDTLPDPRAHLAFVQSAKDGSTMKSWGESSVSLTEQIAASAADRSHGFVQHNGRLYQYACRHLGDTALRCAGYRHDTSYLALLSAFQSGYAAERSAEELRPRYLVFVTMVFVVLAAVTGILAYAFSNRLSRSLARPLMDLSRASQRIADGDFQQQVASTGTGEISTLIENFNRMVRQLETTSQRLAQSQRVAAWRHLARRFAHELKNPLQPILISLYRIEQSLDVSGENSRLKEALQAASQEITHLMTLANRFSQLAQLPSPNVRRVGIRELLTSLAQLYREQLEPYDFRLVLPPQELTVEADETYLREALHNLLRNAIEASESGGRIELEARPANDVVDLTVRDLGAGMSPEVAGCATMPYFTTKHKGSGLGLAVTEKIVTEVGGQLRISSDIGRGTTVTITLSRKGAAQ